MRVGARSRNGEKGKRADGVNLTTAFRVFSVNQRLPSGPLVIPCGTMLQPPPGAQPAPNVSNWPSVLTRPIASGKPLGMVNQSAPSDPPTMSSGEPAVGSGSGNSVILPLAS